MRFICAIIFCLGSSCPDALNYNIRFQYASVTSLAAEGFTTIGKAPLTEMLQMELPSGLCKQNVCGFDAGLAAGFLLTPREQFYDPIAHTNRFNDLAKQYPIMRAKDFPDRDLGVFPNSLSKFWTAQYVSHNAQSLGFNDYGLAEARIKSEIRSGRPVIVQVRIAPDGLPVFMPDPHFGARTFWNSHYIVVVGFKEQRDPQWLIRDNGGLGLGGPSTYYKIPASDFENALYLGTLAEDVHSYVYESSYPVFLADGDDDASQSKLRRDFELLQDYNILVFTNK